ncbi:MAG TPA: DUF4321 domain-containing protein [bacterium]|mgnify:CR=1 FL=1|nr:DUF4321 domain-containing protein [bacterium]HOM25970.1 DUF4321 domain-containing protein [bacterium]
MKIFYVFSVLFLCAMIGSCIGEIILMFIPQGTIYYNFLSNHLSPVWEIKQLDLIIFNLSFSIRFNINSFTLLGLIIGSIFSLKKV